MAHTRICTRCGTDTETCVMGNMYTCPTCDSTDSPASPSRADDAAHNLSIMELTPPDWDHWTMLPTGRHNGRSAPWQSLDYALESLERAFPALDAYMKESAQLLRDLHEEVMSPLDRLAQKQLNFAASYGIHDEVLLSVFKAEENPQPIMEHSEPTVATWVGYTEWWQSLGESIEDREKYSRARNTVDCSERRRRCHVLETDKGILIRTAEGEIIEC